MKRLKSLLIGLLCLVVTLPIIYTNNVYAAFTPAWENVETIKNSTYEIVSPYFDIQGIQYVGANAYFSTGAGWGDYSSTNGTLYILDTSGNVLASKTYRSNQFNGASCPDNYNTSGNNDVSMDVPYDLFSKGGTVRLKFQGSHDSAHSGKVNSYCYGNYFRVYRAEAPKPVFTGDFGSGNLTPVKYDLFIRFSIQKGAFNKKTPNIYTKLCIKLFYAQIFRLFAIITLLRYSKTLFIH